MKTRIMNVLVPLLVGSSTTAFAADQALSDTGGPLIWLFIGFGALVLVVQAIPAGILLYSMIKAVFSPSTSSTTANATREGR